MKSFDSVARFAHLSTSRRVVVQLALLAAVVVSQSLYAAGITIGPGSSLSLGSGSLNLGCGDLAVVGSLNLNSGSIDFANNVAIGGILNGNSGSLNLGGDWNNQGTFNPDTSSVVFQDACGDGASAMLGNTVFNALTVQTSSGKTLGVAANSEQQFIAALNLLGAPGNLLRIMSSSPGIPAFFSLFASGSQSISHVNVSDNQVHEPYQQLAPGFPQDSSSIDGGNSSGWFNNAIVPSILVPKPVPALTFQGLLFFQLLMMIAAGWVFRRSPRRPGIGS